MHGLWSWVPSTVSPASSACSEQKLKPGGAVHVSYNALPAWGGALRHAAGDARLRSASWLAQRSSGEGLKLVQELQKADALQIIRLPWVNSLVERMAAATAESNIWRTST